MTEQEIQQVAIKLLCLSMPCIIFNYHGLNKILDSVRMTEVPRVRGDKMVVRCSLAPNWVRPGDSYVVNFDMPTPSKPMSGAQLFAYIVSHVSAIMSNPCSVQCAGLTKQTDDALEIIVSKQNSGLPELLEHYIAHTGQCIKEN